MKTLILFLGTSLLSSALAAPCTLDPFCPVETVDKRFQYEGRDFALVTISQQMKTDGEKQVLNQALLVSKRPLLDFVRIPLDIRKNNQFDATERTWGGNPVNRYSILGSESRPRAIIGYLMRITDNRSEDPVVLLLTLRKDMENLKPRILLTEKIAKQLYTQLCHKAYPRTNAVIVLSMLEDDVDYTTRKQFQLTVPGAFDFDFEYDVVTDKFSANYCPL